jgi:hypothetical protein
MFVDACSRVLALTDVDARLVAWFLSGSDDHIDPRFT